MGKTKIVELDEEQRAELEKGYQNGKSHAFRHALSNGLAEKRKANFCGSRRFLGGCEVVVNNWLKRYLEEGIKGLKTRAGRGRPPILSQQNPEHLTKGCEHEIKKHPNSVKTVVAALRGRFGFNRCTRKH